MLIWNFEVQNSDKDFHNPANTGCAREPLSDIEEKSKIFDLKRTGSVGLLAAPVKKALDSIHVFSASVHRALAVL